MNERTMNDNQTATGEEVERLRKIISRIVSHPSWDAKVLPDIVAEYAERHKFLSPFELLQEDLAKADEATAALTAKVERLEAERDAYRGIAIDAVGLCALEANGKEPSSLKSGLVSILRHLIERLAELDA